MSQCEVIHQYEENSTPVYAATRCLICGEAVVLHFFERGPKICEACKSAVINLRKTNSSISGGTKA